MWTWLLKLDPNVVISVLSLVGTYIYHQLSPSTQATISNDLASAQKAALDVADGVMKSLTLAAEATGMSRAQLQSQLWAEAKVQLAHIGVDVDHMPPALNGLVNALVSKYLATYKPVAASTEK